MMGLKLKELKAEAYRLWQGMTIVYGVAHTPEQFKANMRHYGDLRLICWCGLPGGDNALNSESIALQQRLKQFWRWQITGQVKQIR